MSTPSDAGRNRKEALLLFFSEPKMEPILDRYNYRSCAVTAQLIVYPMSFGSGRLRVVDRFYHRFADSFRAAYLDQLRQQTPHIPDHVFNFPSRPSLWIAASNAPDLPWIDLDGSQLVSSAIAGIQTNGQVVVFYILIPEKSSEPLQKKAELYIDKPSGGIQACHARFVHVSAVEKKAEYGLFMSVRWHPSLPRALLVVKKSIILVFCIDRAWRTAKHVSMVNVLLPLLDSQLITPTWPPGIGYGSKVIATHISDDGKLLITMYGPHNKSYGLLRMQEADGFEKNVQLQNKYTNERNAVNFITVHKLENLSLQPAYVYLSYAFLSETASQFDAEHGLEIHYTEIFQHCILLQPPSGAAYFFATISKCIGLPTSCLTLWHLNGEDHNDYRKRPAQCVQRLFFSTPSVNTLITSMEYNQYSTPYIFLSSTTFDPFQTQSNYDMSRKQYVLTKARKAALLEFSSDRGKSQNPEQMSVNDPVIFVDFTQQSPPNEDGSQPDSRDFRTLFHSHILSLDWRYNAAIKMSVPYIESALSRSDRVPSQQIVPCQSLYRFVENSLIGQQTENSNLKLHSRQHTIGMLRIGVLGIEYLEFFTPKRIKLRCPSTSAPTNVSNIKMKRLPPPAEETAIKPTKMKKLPPPAAPPLEESKSCIDEDTVKKMFFSSVSGLQFRIIEVQDVRHRGKEAVYEKILEERILDLNRTRGDVEMLLWHGCKNMHNLPLIIKNGFDRSHNTTSKFGKGTYFAREASYCVNRGYCGSIGGVSYIFLCKVIVGDFTRGSSSMQTIPQKPDDNEYDTLVNRVSNPTIFVVFRDYHALPICLVKYKSVINA